MTRYKSTNEYTCPICGEPTFLVYGKYPRKDGLCSEHGRAFYNGEIEQCIFCGKWFDRDYEECPFCEDVEDDDEYEDEDEDNNEYEDEDEDNDEEDKNNVIVINEKNKYKCITCGTAVDGVLFCKKCYYKYKEKKLYFVIDHCSSVELLDAEYEGKKECKDGHIVKSKAEREIDNYLYEKNIPHAYERELRYGNEPNEVLKPDFYLKDYLGKDKHVYIEYWGYNENNLQYTKTKKFKMPIYKKLGITLINIYEKTDSDKIDSHLEWKLNKSNIKEGEINFEE